MARCAGIDQQIVIGAGSHATAHGRQTGNKLRSGQFELADQHTAGKGPHSWYYVPKIRMCLVERPE